MAPRLTPLCLLSLVVLAGCLGATPGLPGPAAGSTATPAPTPTPDATPTDTPTADGAGPWGVDPVVVAVRGDREHRRATREAASYWERVDERYLGYEVEYAVRPNATAPDLLIEFVSEVPLCHGVSDAVGCAPVVTGRAPEGEGLRVYVKTGLAPESTRLVVKHELGHTLGLGHDDPPRDVMAARSVLYTEPRPNATEREFPWADSTFRVAVNASDAADPEGARDQVDHALAYYERGAPGAPQNLTFVTESTGAEPEVVVVVGDGGCTGSGSCVHTRGVDPDGDGAIEEYRRLEIRIDDLDTAAVGWHVGYWLAHGLGMEPDAEKPPPFRSATYEERRSRWWR
jgi:hypothetical protein